MHLYNITRAFADSWMLLLMVLFFLGVFLWVLRPGSGRIYRDTADIPFRHDGRPAAEVTVDTPDMKPDVQPDVKPAVKPDEES